MTAAGDLYGLQELDTAIDGRVKERAAAEEKLKAEDATTGVRARVAERRAWLDAARVRAADIDTAIIDLNAKVTPLETRLYDGSVRIARDLEDLQKELEMFLRQRRVLEDQQLAVMEDIEQSVAGLEGDRAVLTELDASRSNEQQDLAQQIALIDEDLIRLRAEREHRAQRIDATRLRLYEHLRVIKRGRAVAKMERGTCSGCRITLPTIIQQRARNPMQVVQCTSCERILYSG